MKRSICGIIAFVVISVNGTIYAQSKNADIVPKIEEVLNKAVELDLFSGCVLIAKGDQVLFAKAYGEANKDFHIINTLDTKFDIASCTKPFTSVALMMLVEQDQIRLSDPVTKYLPDFPFGNKITVYHLLTHTSGLGDYEINEEYIGRQYEIKNFEEILQIIYKMKLLFDTPGEKFSYSNSGALVVGSIIEKVSGIKYADFLRNRIFIPLNLKHTEWQYPETTMDNRAVGYRRRISGGFSNTLYQVTPASPGTGLRTTVHDLFIFSQAIHSNTLLTETSKRIMLSPYKEISEGMPYALFWFVLNSNISSDYKNTVIGHNGGEPGYKSMFYHYDEGNFTIIVLSNYHTGHMVYPMLESIIYGKNYDLPKDKSLSVFLYHLLKKDSISKIQLQIKDILSENGFNISSPNTLNDMGYSLMNDGELEMAIQFFVLNVILFPDDSNAYDSLGEAYRKNGNTKLAIENYEKALIIDPNYENAENAKEILKKIKEK